MAANIWPERGKSFMKKGPARGLAFLLDGTMSTARATLCGFTAVALWSTLALLTAMTGSIPPLQLTALAFAGGFAIIVSVALLRGRVMMLRPTPQSLLLGIFGLFGDSALYFAALKFAPPADANLIHYLWPLLLVLFAALLPGGKLHVKHLFGATLGLAALIVIAWSRASLDISGTALVGYGCALAGAIVWATYSIISSQSAKVPSESIGITCGIAALLALALHHIFEVTQWPANWTEWTGVIGLGFGPMGLAFMLWDIGMKKGDVPLLGVLSYSAPVISTALLLLAGFAQPSWALVGAVILIVVAALVATRGGKSDQAAASSPD